MGQHVIFSLCVHSPLEPWTKISDSGYVRCVAAVLQQGAVCNEVPYATSHTFPLQSSISLTLSISNHSSGGAQRYLSCARTSASLHSQSMPITRSGKLEELQPAGAGIVLHTVCFLISSACVSCSKCCCCFCAARALVYKPWRDGALGPFALSESYGLHTHFFEIHEGLPL